MKCANCKNDALYVYKITEGTTVLYCRAHLPKFLEPLRKAGNLETTEAYKRVTSEALRALSPYPKPVPRPVAEPEAVVEEVSETVVEEPAEESEEYAPPKPKRKKAAPKVEEDASNS